MDFLLLLIPCLCRCQIILSFIGDDNLWVGIVASAKCLIFHRIVEGAKRHSRAPIGIIGVLLGAGKKVCFIPIG